MYFIDTQTEISSYQINTIALVNRDYYNQLNRKN